jgi:hypothetical protein
MRADIVAGVDAARRVRVAGWLTRLGAGWCRLMHSEIAWPVNGYYWCRKCYRRFPVPWETAASRPAVVPGKPQRAEEPLPAFAEAAA